MKRRESRAEADERIAEAGPWYAVAVFLGVCLCGEHQPRKPGAIYAKDNCTVCKADAVLALMEGK